MFNRPISVLLIDDDPDTQLMLNMVMEQHHYPLTVAANAKNGLDYLTNNAPPDAIILDIRLPDKNGYDVLDTIRRMGLNKTPIIAVTAFYSTENPENMRERGFDGYFPKPLNPKEFIPYLQKLTGLVT
jgi:two-component system, NtrC family, response regulator AtoC